VIFSTLQFLAALRHASRPWSSKGGGEATVAVTEDCDDVVQEHATDHKRSLARNLDCWRSVLDAAARRDRRKSMKREEIRPGGLHQ